MKYVPGHMRKLNRRVIRSMHREEAQEELPEIPQPPENERQKHKMHKIEMREDTLGRLHPHKSEAERNWEMKHRTPIFDRNNAEPKHAKSTRKKTPKI